MSGTHKSWVGTYREVGIVVFHDASNNRVRGPIVLEVFGRHRLYVRYLRHLVYELIVQLPGESFQTSCRLPVVRSAIHRQGHGSYLLNDSL